MQVVDAGILFGVGLVSAVVNTLAGGGTLLTVPAMILMGFSPLTANATNRLTLILQGVGATAHYHRKGTGDLRLSARLSVIACVGAVAGAYIATLLDERAFRGALAVLMIGALAFLLLRPARWFRERPATGPPRRGLTAIGFVFVGLYGGFFGAGVGVFILLILSAVERLDLVTGNAVKSAVVLMLSVAAAAVFAWGGHIDYMAAIPLAAGNVLGGWVGAHLSLKGGDVWIRRTLLVVVVISVYKLVTGA